MSQLLQCALLSVTLRHNQMAIYKTLPQTIEELTLFLMSINN